MRTSWWQRRVAGGICGALALSAALVAPAGAQQADGGRAGYAGPLPTPLPRYPLAPTPVLGMRAFGPHLALSGFLTVRATHRHDSTAIGIHRARLTAQVGPLPYLGVRLQADLAGMQVSRAGTDSARGFALTDGYAELSAPVSWLRPGTLAERLRPTLLVGQFKAPFSLEYLTPITILKTTDFAQAVDRLSLKRDIGVMGQAGWGRRGTFSVAVMNGAGPNATSNPDNRLLAVSRLTLLPVPFAAVSAKLANRGSDHAWGYDGRLLWRGLTVEGETVFRKRPISPTERLDAGGGYALVAVRVRPWLEPVYRYDRYWETRSTTGPAGASVPSSRTWHVVGVNVVSVPEWLRLQLDWRHRRERPAPTASDELIAEMIAAF